MNNSYNPAEYWKEAGKTYYNTFNFDNDDFKVQEICLISYLNVFQFDSVLELGCGFGRITESLMRNYHVRRYVAMDVSRDQLNNAPKLLHVEYIESDIESFKIDEKFDLVIAVEVLMHQLPSEIQGVINKMKSLSKMHVMNVDYYENAKIELASHNFKHNYPKLYGRGCKVVNIPSTKQSIFHWVKPEQIMS